MTSDDDGWATLSHVSHLLSKETHTVTLVPTGSLNSMALLLHPLSLRSLATLHKKASFRRYSYVISVDSIKELFDKYEPFRYFELFSALNGSRRLSIRSSTIATLSY